MEDNLTKIKKMEDDLKLKWKATSKRMKNGRQPQKKNRRKPQKKEDDLKKRRKTERRPPQKDFLDSSLM
jgi:hypothetical protein